MSGQQTEIVCAMLKKGGFNAHQYHGGMPHKARAVVQNLFMTSKDIVVSGPWFGNTPTCLIV